MLFSPEAVPRDVSVEGAAQPIVDSDDSGNPVSLEAGDAPKHVPG